MKQVKHTKYEKKEIRRQNIASAMAGGGIFLYENSSKVSELTLPRPTRSGLRLVGPGGRFQGDDYYMQLVKAGLLRLIEVLQTPEQEKEAQMLEEQKLILDQPDRVTTDGTVEQVVQPKKTPAKKLNESGRNKPQPEILLNEQPDGFVIVND